MYLLLFRCRMGFPRLLRYPRCKIRPVRAGPVSRQRCSRWGCLIHRAHLYELYQTAYLLRGADWPYIFGQTPDSARAMMQQTYPRPQYSASTAVLPPLQQSRNYPQGTNGATRGYYEQSPQATPILPSQPLGTSEAERYGVPPGHTGYDHSGSANGTPR
jgi:hypothetical protein